MELVVYYEPGKNRAWLQPDVQVVFGVGRRVNCRTFKVSEEGTAPDTVLNVASTAEGEGATAWLKCKCGEVIARWTRRRGV